MTTLEDRLKALEIDVKAVDAKVEGVAVTANKIAAQMEVVSPRDLVDMKTNLARVETRVYGISAAIAAVGTMIVSWVKGLVA